VTSHQLAVDKPNRVIALDAGRGFALMWSAIEHAFPPALQMLPASPLRDVSLTAISHSTWHGCSFVDIGFPAYIMLIGMSITFSFRRRIDRGVSRRQLLTHLVVRAGMLFVFAMFYHGGLSSPLSEIRFTRIFHRLAIAILLCGVFELFLTLRGKIFTLVSVLIAYWALMQFFPVPGFGAGHYSPEGNLNHYVDQVLLGAKTNFILSTLGVAGTCIFGLLMGDLFLREHAPQSRLMWLIGGAFILLNLGYTLDSICPINKHIWTPTFVLVSSGWGFLMFSGFYGLTDVLGWKKCMFPLTVLGENPLVSFAAFGILPFSRYADLFAGVALTPYLGLAQPIVQAFVQVLLLWLLVYWLHRNNLIIKI